MTDRVTQAEKAKRLLALHQARPILVLPNIWDPLGARLLQGLGYPAVATASASVAYSLGYADGQRISWAAMVEAVRRVAAAVDLPVTADIEAGYADRPEDLASQVRQILDAGAVGINLEDSRFDRDELYSIPAQQERLRAVRAMAMRTIHRRRDVQRGGGTPRPQGADGFLRLTRPRRAVTIPSSSFRCEVPT